MYEQLLNASQGNQNMAQLIEQLGITDPRIKMMAEFMVRQSQIDSAGPPEGEAGVEGFDNGQLDVVMRENEMLLEENELLIEHLDALAAALGACPDCWGEDRECGECRGTGGPGAYMPDREAFAAYIIPALKRVSAARKRSGLKRKGGMPEAEQEADRNNGNGDHGSV